MKKATAPSRAFLWLLIFCLAFAFLPGCSGGGGGGGTSNSGPAPTTGPTSGPTTGPTPVPTGTDDFDKIEQTSDSGAEAFKSSYAQGQGNVTYTLRALRDMVNYLQSRTDTVQEADFLLNDFGAKTQYFNRVREAYIAPGKQFQSQGAPSKAQKEKLAKLIRKAMSRHKAATKSGIALKKALILSPFNWQFQDWANDKLDTVKACLKDIGFPDPDYKCNYYALSHNVTVEDFKNLSDYGLVYINTHGTLVDGKVVLNTGQLCTSSVYLKYLADFTSQPARLVRVKFFENDVNTYVGITPDFIRKYCGSFLPNSMILVSAENSAADNADLADAFLDKGAYCFMGWNKEVWSETTYWAETDLFSQMISYQKTNGEALDYVMAQSHVTDRETGAILKIIPPDRNDFSLFDVPVIRSLVPSSGSPGNLIQINGSFLSGATKVTFYNNKEVFAIQAVSDSEIKVYVPSGAATGLVTVTTAYGNSNGVNFTIGTSTLPEIISLDPASGAEGSTVTIAGNRLTGATSVMFNNESAFFNIASDNQIVATVPPGATTGPVTVITSGGTSNGVNFTIVATPYIDNIAPSSGNPGDSVGITGSNFTGATEVKFNGVNAFFNVASDSTIMATVPGGATSGPVTVTTPAGTSNEFSFSAIVIPVITGLDPSSGLPGTTVTITGNNFLGATSVSFNGISAPLFTAVNNTQITASVPSFTTTGPVTVTAPGGTSNGYTFIVPGPILTPTPTPNPPAPPSPPSPLFTPTPTPTPPAPPNPSPL